MNKREKEIADREIELYKQSEILRIEKELVAKERGNWVAINVARENRRKAEVEESKAIALLQAKKESLSEVLAIKDNEISLLKGLLEKAIQSFQTINK